MKLIYIAYPFGGNQDNLDDVEFIISEISRDFNANFWAPWIPLCRYWSDDTDREKGIAIDKEAIKRSDEFWSISSSPGIIEEQLTAIDNNLIIEEFESRQSLFNFIEDKSFARYQQIQNRLNEPVDIDKHIYSIIREYQIGNKKYGQLSSPHEGYAVILEELDEMWDDIKKDNVAHSCLECVQVAAVALKYLTQFRK